MRQRLQCQYLYHAPITLLQKNVNRMATPKRWRTLRNKLHMLTLKMSLPLKKIQTDGQREVQVKSSVSLSVTLSKKLNATSVSRVVFAGEDGVT